MWEGPRIPPWAGESCAFLTPCEFGSPVLGAGLTLSLRDMQVGRGGGVGGGGSRAGPRHLSEGDGRLPRDHVSLFSSLRSLCFFSIMST